MLTISDAALAQLESGGGALRVLIRAEVSGVQYAFIDDAAAHVTIDGKLYQGLGEGIEFSGRPGGGGFQGARFSFTLSGSALLLGDDAQDPSELFATIYDEDYKNRTIDVEYALFASAPGDLVAAIPAISGRMVSAPLRIDGKTGEANLTLECQTLAQDYAGSNGGTFGPAHVRRFYSDDEFGDFVPQVAQENTLRWGPDGDDASTAGRGGGPSGGSGRTNAPNTNFAR